jgi:hypothetical protein
MKKFLIAGSSLAAVAAAGSAGAIDVTLGGSIDMGWKYGVGKGSDAMNGFGIVPGSQFQAVTLNLGVGGTTSAGLKFGGNVTLSTADELALDPYTKKITNSGKVTKTNKYMWKFKNEEASQKVTGKAYNVSGGGAVSGGQIVSVKINSAWYDHKSSVSKLTKTWSDLADEAVCKVAGIADAVAGNPKVTRAVSANTKVAAQAIAVLENHYLPAGKLTAGTIDLTAQAIPAGLNAASPIEARAAKVGTNNKTGRYENTAKSVFAGPFMEVKMTSSSTKMVVGAVCVDKDFTQSSTKAYLNVASRIVHVSDASVFIEGGFGKLSLGTSAYTGSVAGVGGAGDQVKVGNTGVVAHLSSVSFMGLSGSAAVDLGTVNINQRPNYAFGTSVDLLGLSIAVEMEDEVQGVDKDGAATNVGYIDKWDAGTSYDLNGMSVAIATDSANDWAMSLGYELMGFSMTSVVENITKGKSKKSGLNIDTSFATSLNGVTVAVSLDEELNWGIGASYTIGNEGLSLYANYSDADGGGKMGAKMSF